MPIKRSISQSQQSLIEFYKEAVDSNELVTMDIGKTMLRIIQRIDNYFVFNQIWGLTSLYHLQLLTGSDASSEAPISFIGNDGSYKLATQYIPELNDYQVNQEFNNEDAFFEHLLLEMRKFEPWKHYDELR